MIIPMRCTTCNSPISGKWEHYKRLVTENSGGDLTEQADLLIIDESLYKGETPQCKALNALGLTRYCCRRMLLSHVEILEHIN